ncbi:O-methyltransferase [Aggregatimonas sangjinii]|nr:class I SAM-dependent methyltransferase [Aggregatimonas sangjinii]
MQDETLVTYDVFDSQDTAAVKEICKNAASGNKWCEFLYSLTKISDTPIVLEMGTNLGISGCYILEAIKNISGSRMITLEGLPQLCEISETQFALIAAKSKYDIRQGLFDDTFPVLLNEDIKFNLIFIDGNHKKDSTIDYFKNLKSKIDSSAIFVFDDINWSAGMREAWNSIKKDKDVNFAIDLNRQGIIIVDYEEKLKNITFKLHLAY